LSSRKIQKAVGQASRLSIGSINRTRNEDDVIARNVFFMSFPHLFMSFPRRRESGFSVIARSEATKQSRNTLHNVMTVKLPIF
jgi:hypothetical protein